MALLRGRPSGLGSSDSLGRHVADEEGYRRHGAGHRQRPLLGVGPRRRRAWRRTSSRSTDRSTLAEVRARGARAAPGHQRLADVLGVCSVLVGDRPVGSAGPRRPSRCAPGDTVEFLPPFAGG